MDAVAAAADPVDGNKFSQGASADMRGCTWCSMPLGWPKSYKDMKNGGV